MSTTDVTSVLPTLPKGIRARHLRQCASKSSAAACDCRPSFEVWAWSRSDGRKVRETFPTATTGNRERAISAALTAAKRWRNERTVEQDDGTLRVPASITVKAAADAWIAKARSGEIVTRSEGRYKPSALRNYEQGLRLRLVPALGFRKLAEVTTDDLARLVGRWRALGMKPTTIRNTINAARVIYRDANLLTSGVVPDPTAGLRLPMIRSKRERIAEPDEAFALIDALPASDRAVWTCAFFAGLRCGELQGLKWEDVDLAGGFLHVKRGIDPREGEILPKSAAGIRSVPITGRLREALTMHKLDTGRESGYVFGRSATLPFSQSSVSTRANRIWRAKGMTPIGLHEARHSAVTLLVTAGVEWLTVSKIAGHAQVSTTQQVYGHLRKDAQRDAGLMLDALLERADTASRLQALDAQ